MRNIKSKLQRQNQLNTNGAAHHISPTLKACTNKQRHVPLPRFASKNVQLTQRHFPCTMRKLHTCCKLTNGSQSGLSIFNGIPCQKSWSSDNQITNVSVSRISNTTTTLSLPASNSAAVCCIEVSLLNNDCKFQMP